MSLADAQKMPFSLAQVKDRHRKLLAAMSRNKRNASSILRTDADADDSDYYVSDEEHQITKNDLYAAHNLFHRRVLERKMREQKIKREAKENARRARRQEKANK